MGSRGRSAESRVACPGTDPGKTPPRLECSAAAGKHRRSQTRGAHLAAPIANKTPGAARCYLTAPKPPGRCSENELSFLVCAYAWRGKKRQKERKVLLLLIRAALDWLAGPCSRDAVLCFISAHPRQNSLLKRSRFSPTGIKTPGSCGCSRGPAGAPLVPAR